MSCCAGLPKATLQSETLTPSFHVKPLIYPGFQGLDGFALIDPLPFASLQFDHFGMTARLLFAARRSFWNRRDDALRDIAPDDGEEKRQPGKIGQEPRHNKKQRSNCRQSPVGDGRAFYRTATALPQNALKVCGGVAAKPGQDKETDAARREAQEKRPPQAYRLYDQQKGAKLGDDPYAET